MRYFCLFGQDAQLPGLCQEFLNFSHLLWLSLTSPGPEPYLLAPIFLSGAIRLSRAHLPGENIRVGAGLELMAESGCWLNFQRTETLAERREGEW